MKITAIIQARSTSVRFPNKALKEINGKAIVEILFKRLSLSKKINKIIFAIPKEPEEKLLKKHLLNLGCNLFEGSNNDVLDRYYQAAKKFKTDIIVRITGDCPLVDSSIIDQMISQLIKKKLDFISNCSPPTYPDGLDVWVCTMKALKKTWSKAKNPKDREHVMNYIINSKNFLKDNLELKEDLSNNRWTIDEPEDFLVMKNIFNHFKNNFNFSWIDVLKLKKTHPEYFNVNKHIIRDRQTGV